MEFGLHWRVLFLLGGKMLTALRFKTRMEQLPNGDRAMHTTAYLDCGHSVEYLGTPHEEEKLYAVGGIRLRNGTTRCRECHTALGKRLFQAIKSGG